ncbi:hypothetical protein OS493_011389 [Desmophyllum pertusum]|uniref:Uncharacterized protein n=1 Tax=Desmophyllum pertusum TaxID=174260 RepID=A0A9X0CLB5_9CNID|nr:hypothetical protein OS493_011389 [Desmophyllum pertusum]
MCDQINEDLCALKESFQNISEEHRELVEKLTHYKNHVTNETSNHTDEMRLISSQEEIVIIDRIPNGLEFDDTLASFHDQATSPGEAIYFDFEGKIAVDEFTLQLFLRQTEVTQSGEGLEGAFYELREKGHGTFLLWHSNLLNRNVIFMGSFEIKRARAHAMHNPKDLLSVPKGKGSQASSAN